MDELLNIDDDGDTVAFYLIELSREIVIALGEALGLKADSLKEMENMPMDMVDAWMKLKDNVMLKSGEPTWKTLAAALGSIEQTSVADKIKRDIEGRGAPRPSSSTTASVSHAAPSGIDDRTEDDFGRKKKKDKEAKPDSGPPVNESRIEDDWPFGGGKNRDQKPAQNRGQYKAKLRLDDDNDEITEIDAERSSQVPYSRRGFYSMKAEKHGVALIINNKEFTAKEHKVRTGTDRDELNLTETWLFLGYHIIVLRDVIRDEMVRTFDKIDKMLRSAEGVANDSFVCCILSHGREGEVFGSDSKPLEYTWIQRYLAKSEVLRSRPKLLFIQACQGSNPGAEALADRLKDIDSDDDRISEYTDFYLSCASVHGDRSYRDIYTGTWFISELCQALCKHSMVMDLDEIQKEVNEKVVVKYQFRDYKQQPRGIDQLRRKVYFFQQ